MLDAEKGHRELAGTRDDKLVAGRSVTRSCILSILFEGRGERGGESEWNTQ